MSITKIRPLWTKYNGFAFRSRLEARLAVFMDHLGWSYEYEPEGFDLGDGTRYLPDFLVTGTPKHHGTPEKFWVEVKGENPTYAEGMKLRKLAYGSGITGYFFVGTHRLTTFDGQPRAIQWHEHMDARGIHLAECWQDGEEPYAWNNYPLSLAQFHDPDDMQIWNDYSQFRIPLTEYVPAINAAKAERFGT